MKRMSIIALAFCTTIGVAHAQLDAQRRADELIQQTIIDPMNAQRVLNGQPVITLEEFKASREAARKQAVEAQQKGRDYAAKHGGCYEGYEPDTSWNARPGDCRIDHCESGFYMTSIHSCQKDGMPDPGNPTCRNASCVVKK